MVSYRVSLLFILLGGVTIVLAGIVACVERDIKKVVAISTLSQLGLLMFTLFHGELELRFIHMSCHALFKALLFLRCGVLIRKSYGIQDSRRIGVFGLVLYVPGMRLVASNLSLMGFPFSAGFYSKDLIIERFFFDICMLENLILIVGCSLTFFYSVRLILVGLAM